MQWCTTLARRAMLSPRRAQWSHARELLRPHSFTHAHGLPRARVRAARAHATTWRLGACLRRVRMPPQQHVHTPASRHTASGAPVLLPTHLRFGDEAPNAGRRMVPQAAPLLLLARRPVVRREAAQARLGAIGCGRAEVGGRGWPRETGRVCAVRSTRREAGGSEAGRGGQPRHGACGSMRGAQHLTPATACRLAMHAQRSDPNGRAKSAASPSADSAPTPRLHWTPQAPRWEHRSQRAAPPATRFAVPRSMPAHASEGQRPRMSGDEATASVRCAADLHVEGGPIVITSTQAEDGPHLVVRRRRDRHRESL